MDAPSLHSQFLRDVLPRIQQDPRVAGVAVAGSIAVGRPDIYSDVDLIVVIDDEAFDSVMMERLSLIGSWADLVAGFTGEHVCEPRLIVTLVGPPLLHVDFKFVRASDFAERVEDPEVLWDRGGDLARSLADHPLAAQSLDLQWIEDRFWIWVHYGATKLGRGELLEVIGFLSYLRETVLGPLAAQRVGASPRGVRHLETIAPDEARDLRATLCGYDLHDARRAVLASVELYRRWLDDAGTAIERRHHAERLAVQYLHDVIGRAS
ncbi:nucleotidyltransferase domain-containing protein [Streptomyces sp. H10-C2]|uniref:nucleotidyltransferase domain-containing protein n=1 Tax=unclassified Streptomyces TaxID=2593676 RepID=UPI0024BA998F|nr:MULTISPECIES: nucleotidyltransferase domain-containing protein [unclassified Streptomyces]MDJ0346784.1 nucleotidyltransferase domain-containing protein [Streptomyces sp. PH10-H1]MDJ0374094.1 nucleotidyltransferase domain-containing protein [Streptomyces sp. H10-C2]